MTEGESFQGMFYEDFQEGDTLISPGRTLTESDVMTFAGLSGDFNQLHTDKIYAEKDVYGGRIAHGLLVLSIVSGLAARMGFSEGTAVALTKIDWRCKSPVFIGDTICAHFTVGRKKKVAQAGGGFVVIDVRVLNQEEELVQRGSWTTLMKGKT